MTLPPDTYVTEVPCMLNDIQEPYVFVKLTERTPRFDVVAITTAAGEDFCVLSCEHLKGAFDLNAANGFL